MTIKWWAATHYTPSIRKVEVISETAKTFVGDRGYGGKPHRQNKVSSYGRLCDTWEDAHSVCLAAAENRLASARAELQRAQSRHGNVKGWTKPEDAE